MHKATIAYIFILNQPNIGVFKKSICIYIFFIKVDLIFPSTNRLLLFLIADLETGNIPA